MLAVEKWAQNKPYLIALLAPQLATASRDMHQGFRHIRERRINNYQYPLPHLPSWFALYRSHKKPSMFLRSLLQFSEFGKESIAFGEAAIEGARIISRNKDIKLEPLPSAEGIEQIKTALLNSLSESFRELKGDFDKTPLAPSVNDDFFKLISEMELESSFFLFVSSPCWLLYRMPATILYRNAKHGDLDAIEKLLRLDPLMLHDPSIGKQIQALRFSNKSAAYRNLLEAPLKRPKTKITRKKMKVSIAGLISAIAITIKFPLTEPDIRALFDAIAQDAEGERTDSDLPESPEAFYKAIQRDREFWLQMLKPDKKM